MLPSITAYSHISTLFKRSCDIYILYFAWEDQSDAAYRIIHTVLINCITVLYESYSTVMQLIRQIQYSYAENLVT